ncbi:MAG TPA: WG repeat-containing protein, partial [Luteibaculaceae bacterium]|nr:WG repeat-containing protein [Luteibaculaceae bacterium]
DDLRENSIRIVGPNNLIGFANTQGEVIITPQFEMASSFYQGKAIIGKGCKKVPWDNHVQEGGCNHFSIICNENGYIDRQGNIQKIGRYSYEEIMNEIKWKPED